MKTYKITTFIQIDETNINAPSLEDLKLAVEESVNTMDNESYGVKEITVDGEEVENF